MNQRWKIMLVACACCFAADVSVMAEQPDLQSNLKSCGTVINFANKQPERKSNLRRLTSNLGAVKTPVATGLWGGEHISLQVTMDGGTVEYDCARGTISQKILLDTRGRFSVRGAHIEEHGGPVREGRQADSVPVQFTGRVKSKRMYLTVKRQDTGKLIGIFTLVYGQESSLVKCR